MNKDTNKNETSGDSQKSKTSKFEIAMFLILVVALPVMLIESISWPPTRDTNAAQERLTNVAATGHGLVTENVYTPGNAAIFAKELSEATGYEIYASSVWSGEHAVSVSRPSSNVTVYASLGYGRGCWFLIDDATNGIYYAWADITGFVVVNQWGSVRKADGFPTCDATRVVFDHDVPGQIRLGDPDDVTVTRPRIVAATSFAEFYDATFE